MNIQSLMEITKLIDDEILEIQAELDSGFHGGTREKKLLGGKMCLENLLRKLNSLPQEFTYEKISANQ